MKRHKTLPRNQWRKKVEELGFIFHTPDMPYWDESIYYTFNYAQIDILEKATATLYDMCLEAAEYIIENKLYSKLLIPDSFIPLIERSWENEDPSIYGRFDLWYDGVNPPKLYEFNADTPTSLFEASIVQ
jgi:glutathionylspermidine synthase